MKFVYIFLLICIHIMLIEARTAWVYSFKQAKSNDTKNSSPIPQSPLNISNSDVQTFVKVLSLLRKQLQYDVKIQEEEKNLKRTMMKCTDLETEKKNNVGVIVPIPDPLEDLTLLSLLYDDTASWSKCTRSCKSQRLRKCRVRGLCTLDYLVEEAFCFFPQSKCANKVRKLVQELSREKQINRTEVIDYSDESDYSDEVKHDHSEDYSHSSGEDYSHNHDEDYSHNSDEDYSHNHSEDYSHNHGEDYSHNHDDDYRHIHDQDYRYNHNHNDDYDNRNHDYHHNNDNYNMGDDEDYSTYNYDDVRGDTDYHSNTFWNNDDYTFGDPDASYDCPGCGHGDYDEYGNSDEASVEDNEESDEDDDSCGQSYAGLPKRSFRIIGGHRAVKGAWPWQVAIVDRYGVNFCGGTIVAPRWVITAGHCVKRGIRIKIAEHDVSRYDGEVELKVRKSFVHPQFDVETYDKDIALLKLPRSVFKTGKSMVKKACLPQKTVNITKKKACIVLGWGMEKETHIYGSDVLMYAKVPIVSDRKCYDAYSDFYMTKHMFCAGFLRGGPDTCLGDSGGPLLCQAENKEWVLQGITSFGDGCGKKGRFGVYTKVKNFMKWINRTMSEN